MPGDTVLNFHSAIQGSRDNLSDRRFFLKGIFGVLIIPILFAPGWLYRFILKSTMWLWWALLVVGRPVRTTSVDALRADTRGHAWASFSLVLAVFSLLTGIVLPVFHASLGAAQGGTHVLLQGLLVLVDWTQFSPFQWLNLASSAGLLLVFFWSGSLIANAAVPERQAETSKQLIWIGIVDNIRQGVGHITIALLLIYVVLLANSQRIQFMTVPPFFKQWLINIYGAQYAVALMP